MLVNMLWLVTRLLMANNENLEDWKQNTIPDYYSYDYVYNAAAVETKAAQGLA